MTRTNLFVDAEMFLIAKLNPPVNFKRAKVDPNLSELLGIKAMPVTKSLLGSAFQLSTASKILNACFEMLIRSPKVDLDPGFSVIDDE